jgi:hypothetical protein
MVLPLGSGAYNSLERPTHGRLGGFPGKSEAQTSVRSCRECGGWTFHPMLRLVGAPAP